MAEHFDIPNLFSDLAIILIVAIITTLVFKWLKQPVVLGYIVAGIITGPHIMNFITDTSSNNIEFWSEIGVVFLLFALGLEFNVKKLSKVGGTGIITVLTELVVMFTAGFFVGKLMGWKWENCVFLGSMISMSSTTIVIKAFDELGLRKHNFTNHVFGVLVLEDLFAVLQLVLLTTIVIGGSINNVETDVESTGSFFSGMKDFFTFPTLFMFIVFFFVIGIYIIPTFFRKAQKIINEENLLLIAIGLCFGMVVLATKFKFSTVLGAFLMGTIISETLESEKIFKLVAPLKYLFGAIFFVSVGLMVDFSVIGVNIIPIIIITLLVLLVKTTSVGFGVFISGQSLKTSIQAGLSLGQIGEFSFIIATVGLTAGVIDAMLYPIIVSVSVLTVFVTPYSMKLAEPLYKALPDRLKNALEHRHHNVSKPKSPYKKFMKKYISRYIFSTVIYICLLAFIMILSFFIRSLDFFPKESLLCDAVAFAITLLAMIPVLGVLIANKLPFRETLAIIRRKRVSNRILMFVFIFLRMLIMWFFVAFLILNYFDVSIEIAVAAAVVFTVFIIFTQKTINRLFKLEERFIQNMNQKITIPELNIPEDLQDLKEVVFTVGDCSEVIGKTLAELNCCEQYGVNVISIIHGPYRFDMPSGSDHLFPHDKLVVVGKEEHLKEFKNIIEKEDNLPERKMPINLYHILLSPESSLIGKSKKEIGFRQQHKCVLICITRDNEYIMNPAADTILQVDDLLWIIGEKKNVLILESL